MAIVALLLSLQRRLCAASSKPLALNCSGSPNGAARAPTLVFRVRPRSEFYVWSPSPPTFRISNRQFRYQPNSFSFRYPSFLFPLYRPAFGRLSLRSSADSQRFPASPAATYFYSATITNSYSATIYLSIACAVSQLGRSRLCPSATITPGPCPCQSQPHSPTLTSMILRSFWVNSVPSPDQTYGAQAQPMSSLPAVVLMVAFTRS